MSEFPPPSDKGFSDPDIEFEEDKKFSVPDHIPVKLYRMKKAGHPPVLLLHGASAQHETFCIPRGHSLAEYLWQNGYEPWLLDWRGSHLVTGALDPEKLKDKRSVLDLDQAAKHDVPLAVKRIQDVRESEGGPRPRVHAVGHCLGAGLLAQAIASAQVKPEHLGRVVLLTLGLFYLPPVDGKLKNTFRVLEDLWQRGFSVIDPRKPEDEDKWPLDLRSFYENFGANSGPHPRQDIESGSSHAFCNRLSFMYGTPYLESNLVPEIHGVRHVRFAKGGVAPCVGERIRALDENTRQQAGVGFVYEVLASGSWRRGEAKGTIKLSGSVGTFPDKFELWADDQMIATCRGKDGDSDDVPPELENQLGAIPLRMYLQGAQNVRRTWAGAFGDNATDRDRVAGDRKLIDEGARHRFRSLAGVTLITGKDNRLWHRRSINEMYQWLIKGPGKPPREIHMNVIPGYGHQDLLWGQRAATDVFPIVLNKGLGGAGNAIASDPDGSVLGPQPTYSK